MNSIALFPPKKTATNNVINEMRNRILKTITLLTIAFMTLAFNAPAATLDAGTTAELTAALAKAKPGDTVRLALGTYTGTPTIPTGVTLRGAGYLKTILDVGAADTGVTLGGDNASVADLAVNTHGSTAIMGKDVKTISVSGVLVRGGAVAVFLQKVDGAHIENCILDGAQTGLSLNEVTGAAIVNNTITHADTTAISLIKVSGSAVFNNLVAHAGVGVSVTHPGEGLLVDHNLYIALFTGKFETEYRRVSLGPWRDMSGGLDAQSVCLPVTFRDAAKGDYEPISRLDWNPGIPTTANWGVSRFGGVEAPVTDIAGDKRPTNPGVGAREAKATDVAADGTFTVKESTGTKSAGIFLPDNTAVRYLFRDLPLPAGTYGFVLPSRSEQGEKIVAGKYELRLVESNLRWTYRGITGNNNQGNLPGESDKDGVTVMAFGPDYSLVTGTGWSEHQENYKSRDLTTLKPRWVMPGTDNPAGLCLGADGLIYILRKGSGPEATVGIGFTRVDNKGELKAWPTSGLRLDVKIPGANGISELGGNLYVTTGSSNEVVRVSIETGKQETAFKAANPYGMVADHQRGLLWMLCGGKDGQGRVVSAFTPDGTEKYTFKQVANPLAVAVNGDRLAIADCDAGKVCIYDIHDPSNPVAKETIGRGDSPVGPIAADRFRFMKSPGTPVLMDLDAAGHLAVLDGPGRPLVFGPGGASVYMSLCDFAYDPIWNNYDGEKDSDGLTHMYFKAQSWTIDAKKGTWAPEAYWYGYPRFKHKGIFYTNNKGIILDAENKKREGIIVSRVDNYVAKPLSFYYPNKKQEFMVVHDENNDGVITIADGDGTPVLDTAGKPVLVSPYGVLPRFSALERNGDIRTSTTLWVFKGVDAKGVPVYEFPANSGYPIDIGKLASPYSFTRGAVGRYSESVVAPDGDLISGMNAKDSPHGMGLANSGCIDLARFRKDGSLRWYLAMNDYGPVQGVKQVTPGFILTTWGHQAEWIGLDDDGLSLGHLGPPLEQHWSGYWVDQPGSYTLFKGNDNKLHVMASDYSVSGWHWLSLQNYDNYRKEAFAFQVSDARATALAVQEPRTTFMMPRADKPRLMIKKLAAPLPIDGDLEKWHKLGLSPQIVITPALGSPNIKGAKDCSGVIRLAYEGENLYVQLLRFDDVVMFDPSVGTHLQDSLEMLINGFKKPGFQFSIGKFGPDGSDEVRRRRFFGGMDSLLPDVAPRIIKVLDNALAVPERKMIEAATGEDLSQAKVIVMEFKLPITATGAFTGEGAADVFPIQPGKGFWLGFNVNDNDMPGMGGNQKGIGWPASFGTFMPKEDGVFAVFE